MADLSGERIEVREELAGQVPVENAGDELRDRILVPHIRVGPGGVNLGFSQCL